MEIEFVCLADSRFQDGRSVAGLRTDGGGWVRLVGRNGPLSQNACTMVDGRELGILDVVRVEAIGPKPVNNQPENYEVDGPKPGILGAMTSLVSRSKPWKPAGQVEPVNAPGVLDGLIRRGPDLFGSQRDREDLTSFDGRSAVTSLTLVEPDSPLWEITSFRGQGSARQIRARFVLAGAEYSLPVTDPKWEERCKVLGYGAHTNFQLLVEETDRVLLTVSLEEPDFSNNPAGECFKSVVGVILLPGAKKGAVGI